MTTIPRCPSPSSRYRLPLVLLFCTLVALFAAATTQAQTCSVPKTFTLDTNKVPQPPQSATNASCEWDLFSWQTFAALNSPADLDRRGFPKSTFKDSAADTPVVWESFKEKAEVFNTDAGSTTWETPQAAVIHSNVWSQNDGFCQKPTKAEKKISRVLYQSAKFHNTLDETVEVAAEALETYEQLCPGHPSGLCNATSNPHGRPVGPRVWKVPTATDTPLSQGAKPVYYEVRVNYDFFDYVVNRGLFDDGRATANAMIGAIQLPARYDSTISVPPANPGIKFAPYDPSKCYTNSKAQTPCRIGSIHIKSAWIQLTPDEVKADPNKYHTTDAIYYELAPGAAGAAGQVCKQPATFGLIGLHIIQRLHLSSTQVPQYPALGGTFIFSTWEHEEISDGSAHYKYVNYLVNQFGTTNTDPSAQQAYPTLGNALPVKRLLLDPQPSKPAGCDLSQPQTCNANTYVHGQMEHLFGKGSVWENYKLVGTQFLPLCDPDPMANPTDAAKQEAKCKQDSNNIGQPYFLANLVIETNQGLQQFRGLPVPQPRLQPPQWATGNSRTPYIHETRDVPPVPTSSSKNFDRRFGNLTFRVNSTPAKGYVANMGGCMGCHGVAQQNGYAFSFVLLDGTRGALADVQQDPDQSVPPTSLTSTLPLGIQSCSGGTFKDGKFCGDGGTLVNLATNGTQLVTNPGTNAPDTWKFLPFTNSQPGKIRSPNFAGGYLLQFGTPSPMRSVITAPGNQGNACTPGEDLGKTLTVGTVNSGGGLGRPLKQTWQLVPYQPPGSVPRQYLIQCYGTSLVLQNGGATSGSAVTLQNIATDPFAAGQIWRLEIPEYQPPKTSSY